VRTIVPVASDDFDFGHLMREAVLREIELEDDNTEGCELDPVALPACSLCPSIALDSLTSDAHQPQLFTPDVPKFPRGSVEGALRKKRGHAKRAVQRMEQKRTTSYGDYSVKPVMLNRHVRPATAFQSQLKTKKLKHTKDAWTGARDKGGYKWVFTLDEMVGENSIFDFQLERWDGR
jgi:hypothetical protein